MKIGILEPDHFSILGIEKLKSIGSISFYHNSESLDSFLNNVEILFIRLNYHINEEFLNKCKNLKILCSPTTGVNHIDLKILTEKQVKLICLKDKTETLINVRATPENTFGLAIALLRGYKKSILNIHNCNWNRYNYIGDELYKMNVGIIGYGRIGKQLKNYLVAFSSNVYTFDVNKIKNTEDIYVSKSILELINECQLIFLTASYQNQIIIKKKHIDALKDKYFVNTSRGELIDEDYLLNKINSEHFRGLALDVISNENILTNNLKNFLKAQEKYNVILTPHISGVTKNSLNTTEDILINILLENLFK